MFQKYQKHLIVILALGLLLRVVFVLFVAEYYYAKEEYFRTGDTYSYSQCAINLVEQGSIRTISNDDKSVAGRLPFYPIVLALFYVISGQNLDLTYQLVIWFQVLLDVLTVFLLYRLAFFISNSYRIGVFAAFLYAVYPFTIFWVPLISTETVGVFTLITGFLFLSRRKKLSDFLFGGAIVGLSVLLRPQNIIFVPVFSVVYFFFNLKQYKRAFISVVLACAGFAVVYGTWVLRNYVLLDKVVLFTDTRGGTKTFTKDVVACRKYIYSIKSGWDPQFFQIVRNEEVDWPEIAFVSREDSLMLLRAEYLAKNCGSGFSHWNQYWNRSNARIPDSLSCNDSIAYYFTVLRNNQIAANPVHYHLIIPMQNLSKALFKTTLTNEKQGALGLLTNALFLYRSILLLLAAIGLFLMIRRKNLYGVFIALFFALVYYYICFTVRNIEMRYFLNNDVIMLIPAAWVLVSMYKWYAIKRLMRKPEQFRI